MPFQDTNRTLRLPKSGLFQAGRSDVDPGAVIEKGVRLPWPNQPSSTWMYYDCTVGCMLDSGIVVHNRLPQVNNLPDSLATCFLDDPDLDRAKVQFGVNLACDDQYTDIVQRMGHARYWFRLWGEALRIAYQVPIPALRKIGGVAAVPYDKNPQWAFNRLAPGVNYGGVPLWHARWSLWYTTAVPPTSSKSPAANPAAHIDGNTVPPRSGIQVPYSQPDDDAVRYAPAIVGQPATIAGRTVVGQ